MDRKSRILLLVDKPGWVFDTIAKAFVKHLSNNFEFKICYVVEEPNLLDWSFDFLYIFFWGETYHQRFNIDPRKVIKEVSSFRWLNESQYGLMTPKEMAAHYLNDAGNVTATSKRMIRMLSPYREIRWMPNGIDSKLFRITNNRTGSLKIGWAGNISDPCKGVSDIVLPAIGNDFTFLTASSLSYFSMPDFYNKIDVFVVASSAEGQPITLLEAMACGCFPVCVDVGIVPEIVSHRKNGLIIDRKVESFRAAFQWCDSNRDYIRQVGQQNSKALQRARSWDVIGEQCRNVLLEITRKD